jgi:hypothetical protein
MSTPHRRIELCSGRTSSADAALQTAGEAAYGQPTGPGPVPAGASLKRKIPGGSGDRVTRFLRQQTKETRQLRVRFFGTRIRLRPTGRFEVEDLAVHVAVKIKWNEFKNLFPAFTAKRSFFLKCCFDLFLYPCTSQRVLRGAKDELIP